MVRLEIPQDARVIPAVAFLPPGPIATRVVLLGHGGSGHKCGTSILDLATRLTRQAGIAAIAIDGPYHGDRSEGPFTVAGYQARIAAAGAEAVAQRMVGDWQAALDAVESLALTRTEVLGYFGLSMGARYGVLLAAALGARLRCAVLGKFGLSSELLPAALDTSRLVRPAAARLTAATLWHVQWDDAIFPRDGQLALFDALGCVDKRLIAFPGGHGDSPDEAMTAWLRFLTTNMT